MCLQCCTEAHVWYIFGPDGGWVLAQAQKNASEEDSIWDKGDWALIRSNDPEVTWSIKPYPSPVTDPLSDEQFSGEEEWFDTGEQFRKELILEPEAGHSLFLTCVAHGFNPQTDGSLAYWLFNHMGKYLEAHPECDEDVGKINREGREKLTHKPDVG